MSSSLPYLLLSAPAGMRVDEGDGARPLPGGRRSRAAGGLASGTGRESGNGQAIGGRKMAGRYVEEQRTAGAVATASPRCGACRLGANESLVVRSQTRQEQTCWWSGPAGSPCGPSACADAAPWRKKE